MGHGNLANLLLRANKHEQARVHYEAALRAARITPSASGIGGGARRQW